MTQRGLRLMSTAALLLGSAVAFFARGASRKRLPSQRTRSAGDERLLGHRHRSWGGRGGSNPRWSPSSSVAPHAGRVDTWGRRVRCVRVLGRAVLDRSLRLARRAGRTRGSPLRPAIRVVPTCCCGGSPCRRRWCPRVHRRTSVSTKTRRAVPEGQTSETETPRHLRSRGSAHVPSGRLMGAPASP
jgi:hypothetical protein